MQHRLMRSATCAALLAVSMSGQAQAAAVAETPSVLQDQGRSLAGPLTPASMKALTEAAERLKLPLPLMQAADGLGMWRGGGAGERLDAIIRAEFEGNGVIYQPAKSGKWAETKVKQFIFSVDYSLPASRVMLVTTDAAGKDQKTFHVVRENFAWDETAPGIGGKATTDSAEWRRREIEVLPHSIMRAVFAADRTKVKLTQQGGKHVITAPVHGVTAKITLAPNFRPERVELPVTHPVLGKTTLVATYSDYKDWDGYEVFFPQKIQYSLGGKPFVDLTATKHAIGMYLIFPVPPAVQQAAKN